MDYNIEIILYKIWNILYTINDTITINNVKTKFTKMLSIPLDHTIIKIIENLCNKKEVYYSNILSRKCSKNIDDDIEKMEELIKKSINNVNKILENNDIKENIIDAIINDKNLIDKTDRKYPNGKITHYSLENFFEEENVKIFKDLIKKIINEQTSTKEKYDVDYYSKYLKYKQKYLELKAIKESR